MLTSILNLIILRKPVLSRTSSIELVKSKTLLLQKADEQKVCKVRPLPPKKFICKINFSTSLLVFQVIRVNVDTLICFYFDETKTTNCAKLQCKFISFSQRDMSTVDVKTFETVEFKVKVNPSPPPVLARKSSGLEQVNKKNFFIGLKIVYLRFLIKEH